MNEYITKGSIALVILVYWGKSEVHFFVISGSEINAVSLRLKKKKPPKTLRTRKTQGI